MDKTPITLKKDEAIARLNNLVDTMMSKYLNPRPCDHSKLIERDQLLEAITSIQNLIELLKFCTMDQVRFHFFNTRASADRKSNSTNNIPNIVIPGAVLSVNSRNETVWETFTGTT